MDSSHQNIQHHSIACMLKTEDMTDVIRLKYYDGDDFSNSSKQQVAFAQNFIFQNLYHTHMKHPIGPSVAIRFIFQFLFSFAFIFCIEQQKWMVVVKSVAHKLSTYSSLSTFIYWLLATLVAIEQCHSDQLASLRVHASNSGDMFWLKLFFYSLFSLIFPHFPVVL